MLREKAMGTGTSERNEMRKMFSAAFTATLDEAAKASLSIVIIDFMQYVKYIKPKYRMLSDIMNYFVGRVQKLMLEKFTNARVFIVLVDGRPVPVKRMVEHVGRYKEKNVFSAKKGPYLPKNWSDLVPEPWIQFAGNYKLLRRELYPLLFNAFLFCTHFVPRPGQMLVLSGFPSPSPSPAEGGGREDVQPWNLSSLPITKQAELADADMYHRVYFVEHRHDG